MKRDILKLTAIFAGMAAIAGCTAMGHGYSRYGDHHAAKPLNTYLRPAPRQPYSFSSQSDANEVAKIGFQPAPEFVDHSQPAALQYAQLAGNVSRENGVMVHRPAARNMHPAPTQTMRHIEIAPEPVPSLREDKTQETYVFEETKQTPAAPMQPPVEVPSEQLPEPMPEFEYESSSKMSDVDVSYVKMGGGSDIADWNACETETGGYVEWTQAGYVVDPAFDNCMRVKGYKPESEAEEVLAGEN